MQSTVTYCLPDLNDHSVRYFNRKLPNAFEHTHLRKSTTHWQLSYEKCSINLDEGYRELIISEQGFEYEGRTHKYIINSIAFTRLDHAVLFALEVVYEYRLESWSAITSQHLRQII